MEIRRSFKTLPLFMAKRPWEILLISAAAVILLFMMMFSFWLARRMFADAETAETLTLFSSRTTQLLQMLRTAESSQRGYLMTGTAEFLRPYRELSPALVPLIQDLSAQAPAEPPSAKTISQLVEPLKAKLAEMAKTIALADGGERDEAIKLVKAGAGRELTDIIEDKIHNIQQDVAKFLANSQKSETRLHSWKVFFDGSGTLLILALTFGSLWSLVRANSETEEARQALTQANTELEDMVAQRTSALNTANDEIQRFAYIVSHDLRSPLVNIMGFTSELETLRSEIFERLNRQDGEPVSEQLRKDFDEAISFIKSSIARMDRLISAILQISREGGRPLNRDIVDLNGLLEGLVAAMEHQIREKGAAVHIAPLPTLMTDRLALEQIFANLIDNAVKFLKPDGQGVIEIAAKTSFTDIVFSVSDNGRGIDPKDHKRIFELFRRSGRQDVSGEGIGLAYVSALVTRLGGTVEVDSDLGRGSVFKIKLPRAIISKDRRAA